MGRRPKDWVTPEPEVEEATTLPMLPEGTITDLITASGIYSAQLDSPAGREVRRLAKGFESIAKDGVPEPVVKEAVERLVACLFLRRKLEAGLVKLGGSPAHGAAKIDAGQRAAFNSTMNAWRNVQRDFNEAIKMLRTPEKRSISLPLGELLGALGKKVSVVEVEYETVN